MVYYFCERCGYNTHHRSVFLKHLRRKNPCKTILKDVPITIILEKYKTVPFGSKTVPFGSKTVPFLEPFLEQRPLEKKNIKNSISCMYCKKKYSRIGNLNKHYKICKIKKNMEHEKENQLKTLKQENNLLQEKIVKLEKYNQNITTNTQINIGSITNNIIINNYGNEDISYIKKDEFTKFLKNMPPGVLKLIEKIHFNPKHPENTNIRITNKKEQFIQVRRKNKWLLEDKCEIINNLLNDKYQLLEDHLLEIDNNILSNNDKKIIERFRYNYGDNETYVKNLLKKIELLILNNSK